MNPTEMLSCDNIFPQQECIPSAAVAISGGLGGVCLEGVCQTPSLWTE